MSAVISSLPDLILLVFYRHQTADLFILFILLCVTSVAHVKLKRRLVAF